MKSSHFIGEAQAILENAFGFDTVEALFKKAETLSYPSVTRALSDDHRHVLARACMHMVFECTTHNEECNSHFVCHRLNPKKYSFDFPHRLPEPLRELGLDLAVHINHSMSCLDQEVESLSRSPLMHWEYVRPHTPLTITNNYNNILRNRDSCATDKYNESELKRRIENGGFRYTIFSVMKEHLDNPIFDQEFHRLGGPHYEQPFVRFKRDYGNCAESIGVFNKIQKITYLNAVWHMVLRIIWVSKELKD